MDGSTTSPPAPYRERLTAPAGWWLAIAALAVVLGWLLLVVFGPTVAMAAAVATAVVAGAALARWAGLRIAAGPGWLRAGDAHLERPDLGPVTALSGEAWQAALREHTGPTSFWLTRPWVRSGLLVEVADPRDPVRHWLVSSRDPGAVVAAVGQTGPDRQQPDAPDHPEPGRSR